MSHRTHDEKLRRFLESLLYSTSEQVISTIYPDTEDDSIRVKKELALKNAISIVKTKAEFAIKELKKINVTKIEDIPKNIDAVTELMNNLQQGMESDAKELSKN